MSPHTVLITGGSSGIGLAAAIEYAKRGAHITIVARNQKKLDAGVAKIREHLHEGMIARTISCDTSASYEECKKKLVNGDIRPVDVLVNSAGISVAGAFDELPVEEFSKMIQTNVRTTINNFAYFAQILICA